MFKIIRKNLEVDEEWHNQGYDLDGNNRPYWNKAVTNEWTKTADAAVVDSTVMREESCGTPPLPPLPGTVDTLAVMATATTVN